MKNWEITVLGWIVQVQAQRLEEGWDIGIFGGCRTHVGAVTLAEPDGHEQTLERSGHKDSHVSRIWAMRLAQTWGVPVCVRCGIHYDGATSDQIREIVSACNQLLETVIQQTVGEC